MLKFPTLLELPTACVALHWLLDSPAESGDADILADVCQSGLVREEARGHWKVDGKKAMRFARAAIQRVPEDSTELGRLLHGLGELEARSHAPFSKMFARWLQPLAPRYSWLQVLNAAAEFEKPTDVESHINSLGFLQWMAKATLDWENLRSAIWQMQGYHWHIGSGFYGMCCVARVGFAIEPRAVDSWVENNPDNIALVNIGNAVIASLNVKECVKQIDYFLQSRIGSIQCLAIASLIYHVGRHSLGYADFVQLLTKNGISLGDAIWASGFWFKQATQEKKWLDHTVKAKNQSLEYLEESRDPANKPNPMLERELRRLRNERDDTVSCHAKLSLELDALFSKMASAWPMGGLTERQLNTLERAFIDTPEKRYHLACALANSDDKKTLLKRNIAELESFLSLNEPGTDEYLQPIEASINRLFQWAARSLIALYSDDKKSIGKRTSLLVEKLAKFSDNLLKQPFIAARQPGLWQSVATRAAGAYLFALIVVGFVPIERRAEVIQLNQHALDYAFRLLRSHLPEPATGNTFRIFDALALLAVHQMAFCKTPDDARKSWALQEDLAGFPRALALWSSPVLVEQHKDLAYSLFRRVAQIPLSVHDRDKQLSRMVTLLDQALAYSHISGATELVSWLIELWADVYQDWCSVSKEWADAACMLANALRQDGPDRAKVLANQSLSSSYCRQLIETAVR